ncbi:MAG: hypothetical protein QXW41_09115 [Fervidicoccaceae archaeon]
MERYKKIVGLATGDIRRYRRASEEIKTAIYLTPLSVTLPLVLYYLEVLRDLALLTIIGISLGLVAWFRVIDTITSLQSFRRRLEEELPFFTLTAAAVSRTGLEPVELLRFLANSEVFQAFKELGKRFWSLSEAFGSSEGLSMLSRLTGGRVRLFLSEYSANMSSGTALQYLRDRAADFMKTVAVEVERSLSFRMSLALLVSMFFSVAPVLMIGMSMLFAVDVGGEGAEVPAFIHILPVAMLSASALLLALPGYPVATHVSVDKRTLTTYRALFITGALSIAIPPLVLYLGLADTHAFRELALYTSTLSLLLGAAPFASFISSLLLRVDDVVEDMARHVRVYRSMHLYKSEKIESLARKRVRPWLVDYLGESVEFFRLLGDVDPAVFDVFVVFVFEVQRCIRKALAHIMLMVGAVALCPVLTAATMSLGAGLGVTRETLLIGYASSLSFGLLASKIALGRNVSTLLPGLAVLLYSIGASF